MRLASTMYTLRSEEKNSLKKDLKQIDEEDLKDMGMDCGYEARN